MTAISGVAFEAAAVDEGARMLRLFVNTDHTLGAARTLCVAQVGRWKNRAKVSSDSGPSKQ
jgi:hypothetical protein